VAWRHESASSGKRAWYCEIVKDKHEARTRTLQRDALTHFRLFERRFDPWEDSIWGNGSKNYDRSAPSRACDPHVHEPFHLLTECLERSALASSIQIRPPGRLVLAHYWYSIGPNQQRRAGLEISLSLSAYNATKIVVGLLACWCVPSTLLKAMYPLSSSPLRPVDCQMGSNMSEQNIYDPLDIASRIEWSFDCSRIGGKLSLYSYFKSSGIRYYILALASKFNFRSMIESSNFLRGWLWSEYHCRRRQFYQYSYLSSNLGSFANQFSTRRVTIARVATLSDETYDPWDSIYSWLSIWD